jgi:hypothetical protein
MSQYLYFCQSRVVLTLFMTMTIKPGKNVVRMPLSASGTYIHFNTHVENSDHSIRTSLLAFIMPMSLLLQIDLIAVVPA